MSDQVKTKNAKNTEEIHILITGGCGYIGSHTAIYIKNKTSYIPIIIDINIKQKSTKVLENNNIKIYEGNINNSDLVSKIIETHNILAVIHFAAYINAAESIVFPDKYYENNVTNMKILLETISKNNIKYFIFSSSAAVYGLHEAPIKEDSIIKPISCYGETKLQGEKILEEYTKKYHMKSICLRYFNAAGCSDSSDLGEEHIPEVSLIPKLVGLVRKNKPINIFGSDYPTKDGTCIRDFVHVNDLAYGHIKALELLFNKKTECKEDEDHAKDNNNEHSLFDIFNLGSGKGHTILDVVKIAEKIVGKNIEIRFADRRKGDIASSVANIEKAENILKWKTQYSLIDIIQSSFNYQEKHGSEHIGLNDS